MADLNKSLQDASAQNAALLQTLAETDHAVPAMKETDRYIADLQKELAATETKLRSLGSKTIVEKQDHDKYQNSIMKKFGYKVTGQKDKFQEKASKEEREYVEALEEENRMKGVKSSLEEKLGEAKQAKANLEPDFKKHNDAQAQLDALYEKIFSGPTPSVPGEDQKEEQAKRALDSYRDVQAKVDAEKKVVSLLGSARSYCQTAAGEAASAHSASTFDLFGGGMMADMMERDAMASAERAVSQLESTYRQAANTSPYVKPLNQLSMAQGHMWSDVFFDTLGGDLRMHDKIKDSERQLAEAGKAIEEQINEAKRRISDLEGQLQKVKTDLDNARKDLQSTRSQAFEQASTVNSAS